MWPWIRRWGDWAMSNFRPRLRHTPRVSALRHGYERAGLTLWDLPVPASADGVFVEALIRFPAGMPCREEDFTFRTGDQEIPVETVSQKEGDAVRVLFTLPRQLLAGDLRYQHQTLERITIPSLGTHEALADLRLDPCGVFVQLAQESIACSAMVAGQGQGLLASATFCAEVGLLPLLDYELSVEFRREASNEVMRVPVRLAASQLTADTALLSVVAPRVPRRAGTWNVTWLADQHELHRQTLRILSPTQFTRSVRVSDARFIVEQGGEVGWSLRPPRPGASTAIGPCFFLASDEEGIAGSIPVQVVAVLGRSQEPIVLFEQPVVISDGPSMVLPGTLSALELEQVSCFALRVGENVLGTLSLAATPTAKFTPEGCFAPPAEFGWTRASDEEMNDRLNRLLEQAS